MTTMPTYQARAVNRQKTFITEFLPVPFGVRCPAAREEFERRMEAPPLEAGDEESLKALRRGWCLGSEHFRKQLLEEAGDEEPAGLFVICPGWPHERGCHTSEPVSRATLILLEPSRLPAYSDAMEMVR